MATRTENWDARYGAESYPGGTEPAPFLRETLPLLGHGRALDLAMGAGRNAVFLAANGWRVTGLDSSRVALERAVDLARERGIPVEWGSGWGQPPGRTVCPKVPGLLAFETDLETATLPVAHFELVLCFNYLERQLFPAIERALRSGGMLLYETMTVAQLAFAGGPRNPEHLLSPNELRAAFENLEILFYREFAAGKGIASLLARKA
jgi:tellurite methyltransferase